MQPQEDSAAGPSAAAPPQTVAGAAAARANKLLGKAGKGIGKGVAAFGGLFKSAPKPVPAGAMELQEMRGPSASSSAGRHSKASSLGSSIATDGSSADQSL